MNAILQRGNLPYKMKTQVINRFEFDVGQYKFVLKPITPLDLIDYSRGIIASLFVTDLAEIQKNHSIPAHIRLKEAFEEQESGKSKEDEHILEVLKTTLSKGIIEVREKLGWFRSQGGKFVFDDFIKIFSLETDVPWLIYSQILHMSIYQFKEIYRFNKESLYKIHSMSETYGCMPIDIIMPVKKNYNNMDAWSFNNHVFCVAKFIEAEEEKKMKNG